MNQQLVEVGQIWRENGRVRLILERVPSQAQYTWPGWRTLDLETGEASSTLEAWLLEGERIA